MPLYSSARILVPVIILGNLLYNLTSLLDHEPPVRNSLTICWTAMPFGHLSLLLCAYLSTAYKFNSSHSESLGSLSIVFAQAESFGFLLFVFHRSRINLLSLLSLYQQAWPSSLPELSWAYYFIIVQCALVQFPSQQTWNLHCQGWQQPFCSGRAIPEMQIFRWESRDNKLEASWAHKHNHYHHYPCYYYWC